MLNKNRLLLVFLLVGTLVFVSCGDSDSDTPDSGDTSDMGSDTTDSDTYPPVEHPEDNVLAFDEGWATPPGGIAVADAPMFVAIGWDDNNFPDGMNWALDMFADLTNADGSKASTSFYFNSKYLTTEVEEGTPAAWIRAYAEGHEFGNHTARHFDGADKEFGVPKWLNEMNICTNALVDPQYGIGITKAEIYGFRTPYLSYNEHMLPAVAQAGMVYDCSIEEGWQSDQNGTNFYWPYDLENGSPGHEALVALGHKEPINPQPGIMELPLHPIIVPPDYQCENYGVPKGLRRALKLRNGEFDELTGKITGFDYNIWMSGNFYDMSKEEVVATLKYTLDLRLKGNRAPFMLGAHTDVYSERYWENNKMSRSTPQSRREAIEAFLTYAASKPEVKITTLKTIYDWVKANSDGTDSQDAGADAGL